MTIPTRNGRSGESRPAGILSPWCAPDRYRRAGIRDNPFRRQMFDSGGFPWIRIDGPPLEDLLAFCREHRVVEIRGPHGSGKSRLLRELHDGFAAERRCRLLQIRSGRWIPKVLSAPGIYWFLDGAERVTGMERGFLRRILRSNRIRAVITLHDGMGFPVLPREPVSEDLFVRIAREALRRESAPAGILGEPAIRAAWRDADGSIRTGLEILHDLFERRLRKTGTGPFYTA